MTDRYDSLEKEEYRKTLWDAIIEAPFDLEGDAVILPGKEDYEIRHAVRAGFKGKRLVCVDKNAAIVAHWSWKQRHRCYGSPLSHAATRLSEDKRSVSVINADLCGNAMDPTFQEMRDAGTDMPLTEPALLAVTVMKGRETPNDLLTLRELARERGWDLDNHHTSPRATAAGWFFAHSAGKYLSPLIGGDYLNARTPMTWGLFLLEDPEGMRVPGGTLTVSNNAILYWVRLFTSQTGQAPTKKDVSRVWGSKIDSRWGGIGNTLRAAGFDPERVPRSPFAREQRTGESIRKTKSLIVQKIRRLAQELGRLPLCKDFNADPAPPGNVSSCFRNFGSWTNALQAAGYKPRGCSTALRGPINGKKYKGVRDSNPPGRFCARFNRQNLGTFDTPEEAARAYNQAAVKYYGEGNCYLNPVLDG